MSTNKHNGDLQLSQSCDIEITTVGQFGTPVTKQKEFEAGRNYWINSVTYKPGGFVDILFSDDSVGKNIPQDLVTFVGTPKVTWPEQSEEKPEPLEEDVEDSSEKKKWF